MAKNNMKNTIDHSDIPFSKGKGISAYKEAALLTKEKVPIRQLINFDKQPENPVKVSIVIPVCNVEQYLEECMDSVIHQTLKDIEIICVNDGSTDHCLEILKTYAAKDSRVKIIDKENAGYGHTMNIGIDMAQGEFIGIVESDDFVALNMYEDLYQIAKEQNADIVKADFNRFFGEKGHYELVYNKLARDDEYYNKIINPSDSPVCFKFIMNTWSGIYKRSFLVSANIRHQETPGASFQDNGFWFKSFAEAQRIFLVNKPYYMNRRDNPNSSVYNPAKVYCANEEYQYIRKYLHDNPDLEKKFLHIFSVKRFHTYWFTLNRIADCFKKEYLHHFAEDFKTAEANHELNQALFTKKEWETLHWIMRDPDEYYYNEYKRILKISVVLPVYNVENYLRQCLDTLMAQTLKEFEVICVDDGSTDQSLNILHEYANKDSRFKIYKQENKGAGAVRNFALGLARGEYIIFLDSDDYFDVNMLKESYQKIVVTNSDICIFKSKQYDQSTGKISDCTFSVRSNQLPKKNPFSLNDMENNPFTSIMGWAWDKLYKKSFILNNGLKFQEQRTTNDMYFVFASLLRAGKITILEKPLYFQRRNVPTSLSATRALSWECFYSALLKVQNELNVMGLYDKYKKDFVNYALHACLWNLNTLPQPQAKELFVKLRTQWFKELEIEDYGPDYFQNKKEYSQFLDIINAVEDGCEYEGYWSYTIYTLEKENKQLKSRNREIRVSATEVLTEASLIEKLWWNRDQKKKLELEIERLQKIKNNKIAKELEQANQELMLIRQSASFKIGRFFTWIPRKIKNLVRSK